MVRICQNGAQNLLSTHEIFLGRTWASPIYKPPKNQACTGRFPASFKMYDLARPMDRKILINARLGFKVYFRSLRFKTQILLEAT